MVLKLIIVLLCAILGGIFNAAMDKLVHHFRTSVFAKKSRIFYDPAISWRNKWKDGEKAKGEKFPGSSTLFSWTTDAWHLFKFGLLTVIPIPGTLLVSEYTSEWYYLVGAYIVIRKTFAFTFHIFYHYIFAKNERTV